jgi:hypothetical protein
VSASPSGSTAWTLNAAGEPAFVEEGQLIAVSIGA